MAHRQIRLSTVTLAPRPPGTESVYRGREHLVIPVVALVEGVLTASNAPGPELVLAEALDAHGWDGRPVFIGHPSRQGQHVSGNSPGILDQEQIGTIFNARVDGAKLLMDVWVDTARALELGADAVKIVERLQTHGIIDVSVGVHVDADEISGVFNGVAYSGRWSHIIPDHLALLPEGVIGACSVSMGCGANRAAQEVSMLKTKAVGLFNVIRTALGLNDEPSDVEIRSALETALVAKGEQSVYVEGVYDAYFIYCTMPMSGAWQYWSRSYTRNDDGRTVTLGDTREEVELVRYYELKTAAAARAAQKPCACAAHAPSAQEPTTMLHKFATRIAALIADPKNALVETDRVILELAQDEPTLDRLATLATLPATVPAERVWTADEHVAALPEALRAALAAGQKIVADLRAAAIKTLKDSGRNKFADAELAAKSQGELDNLVTLSAGTATPAKPAVDFSGQGAPRPVGDETAAPKPPSMADRIAASRKAQK